MTLEPGQQVVWTYKPQRRHHGTDPVSAEVVQVSALRIRIRCRSASGTKMLRWVHPKNLRASAADEQDYLYPEQTEDLPLQERHVGAGNNL